MADHGQEPRRILEKSRTVRRRYQRSNKRLEFTPSQIQRIEREEQRERKAQQLREREKKKLASKKKKADKEAKEREQRKRLGIPEPNTSKIPASQPLLLNFFGGQNKTKEAKNNANAKRECCPSHIQDSTEIQQQEAIADAHLEPLSEVETELGDDWFDDVTLDGQKLSARSIDETGHIPPLKESIASASFSLTCSSENREIVTSQRQIADAVADGSVESFEDDTALFLQELDPSVLQILENPQQRRADLDSVQNMRGATIKPAYDIGISCYESASSIGLLKAETASKSHTKVSLERPVSNNENISKELDCPRFKIHADTDDEYDDLLLSTQDVRDLDKLIAFG